MRQEAKQGLAQMEAMGQMGNSEEAVVEDDLPFDMYDLDVDDEDEYNNMAVGGMPQLQVIDLMYSPYKLLLVNLFLSLQVCSIQQQQEQLIFLLLQIL
jgi:hypothetical protein